MNESLLHDSEMGGRLVGEDFDLAQTIKTQGALASEVTSSEEKLRSCFGTPKTHPNQTQDALLGHGCNPVRRLPHRESLRNQVLECFRDERSRPATGRLLSLGRIVPTEAKPSELSGEILWAHRRGVKAKSPQL
jgi:hypothetical protein